MSSPVKPIFLGEKIVEYGSLLLSTPVNPIFLGEKIVEDGSLLLSTPINPIFLILPHLIKAERNVPLEDLLDDPNFPHLHMIAK